VSLREGSRLDAASRRRSVEGVVAAADTRWADRLAGRDSASPRWTASRCVSYAKMARCLCAETPRPIR